MDDWPRHIQFLYSAKKGPAGKASSILFLERLCSIFKSDLANEAAQFENMHRAFKLFITNASLPKDHREEERVQAKSLMWDTDHIGNKNIEYRRLDERDLEIALGPVDKRKGIVAYVCGPPAMTDWAVRVLRESEGMKEQQVLCEKWW